MPYNIKKQDDKFCVFKDGSTKSLGCHSTHDKAQSQIAAIGTSESEKKTESKAMESGNVYRYKPFQQEDVNYATLSASSTTACANCRFFRGDDDCVIVESNKVKIHAPGVCNEWRIDEFNNLGIPVETSETTINADTINIESSNVAVSARARKAIKTFLDRFLLQVNGKVTNPSISRSGFKTLDSGRWVAWWTNNFEDREKELFEGQAIKRYVERVNSSVMPMPELRHMHIPGTRYGAADATWKVGHFSIASGVYDDTALSEKFQRWQHEQTEQNREIEISHGYLYDKEDLKDGAYKDFHTYEISTLPSGAAANPYTSFIGEKTMTTMIDDKTKDELVKVLGQKAADEIIQKADQHGKVLEDLGIRYKDALKSEKTDSDDSAKSVDMGDVTTLFQTILTQQSKAFTEQIETMTTEVSKAIDSRIAVVEKSVKTIQGLIAQEPPATRNTSTQVDADKGQADFLINQQGPGNKDNPEYSGLSVVEQVSSGGPFDATKLMDNPDNEGEPPPANR